MARADDLRKIVQGGRARGLSDDAIRALVARYDQRVAEDDAPADDTRSLGGLAENAGREVGAIGQALNPTNWPAMWRAAAEAKDAEAAAMPKTMAEARASLGGPWRAENALSALRGAPGAALDMLYERPVTTALAVTPGRVLGKAVNATVGAAGRKVADLAPRMVQAAVKPNVGALAHQSGASWTGIQGQAEKVVDLLLNNRFTNSKQALKAIQDAEARVQAGVLSPPPGGRAFDPTAIPTALDDLATKAEGKILPGVDPAVVRATAADLPNGALGETVRRPQVVLGLARRVPGAPAHQTEPVTRMVDTRQLSTDVTPKRLLDAVRAQSKWDTRKQFGEFKGAEMEAMKTAELAGRRELGAMVPSLQPHLTKQHEALTLFPHLDRMAQRSANRDMVGLPAWVMAAGAGTPAKGVVLGAIAEGARRGQLRGGYLAQDVGRLLSRRAGRAGGLTPAVRAALLAALMREDEGAP